MFRIPEEALGDLRERIGRLDRRASRLGTAPIGPYETGASEPDRHTFVVLHRAAQLLDGWQLQRSSTIATVG